MFRRFLNFIFRKNIFHLWNYRNSACRSCKICGLNQHGYGWSWNPWWKIDWWEDNMPVPVKKCGLSKEPTK